MFRGIRSVCVRNRSLIFSRTIRTQRSRNLRRNKPIVNESFPKLNSAHEASKDIIDPSTKTKNPNQDVETKVDKESLLLDFLNRSKPNSQTDIRFKRQQSKLRRINPNERLKALTYFLLDEGLRNISQYPNPDEIDMDDLSLEERVEFDLKRSLFQDTQILSTTNDQYRCFEVLINILEGPLSQNGGVLSLPVEFYSQVFEISQYIMDEPLKIKTRYITGQLIYNLKTVEFDYLSESQYIEALIEFNNHKEAQRLLIRRLEKVNQRWWYELLIVSYLEVGNLNAAEDTVDLIIERFKDDYLDTRIHLLFIDKYLKSLNRYKLDEWILKYQKKILKYGLIDEKVELTGFNLEEEQVVNHLNRLEPSTKLEYLSIVELILENDEFYDKASELIEFYLNQPNTDSNDLTQLLLNFKLEYNLKIKPILQKLPQGRKKQVLIEFYETYRTQNPKESINVDFLENFWRSLSSIGNFKHILNDFKRGLQLNNDESSKEVNSTNFYYLIIGLIKAKQLDRVDELIQMMERSRSENLEIIPSVEIKHYLPILRYYGRLGNFEEFQTWLKRYESVFPLEYNPIVLTQVINSLIKMKKFDLSLDYINDVLMRDIHKTDKNYDQDKNNNRQLYSTIWRSLRDIKRDQNTSYIRVFPDLRFVFMKMVHENIIPTAKDYHYIISSFLYGKDRFAVLCVLVYLGKRHRLLIEDRTVNLINDYSRLDGTLEERNNLEQIKQLNKLHLNSLKMNSLDPFQEVEDYGKVEFQENGQESENNEVNDKIQQTKWKLSFKRNYEMIKSMNNDEFDEDLARDCFNDFELRYDLNDIVQHKDK